MIILSLDEKKNNSIVEDLKEKRKMANFSSYDVFDFSLNIFEGLIISQGLFDQKNIIKLSRILENKDFSNFFFKNLDKIAESPNAFIFIEDKISQENLKKIEKKALKIYFSKNAKEEEKYNIFFLTNLLLEKNTKKLWLSYLEALEKKVEIEYIFAMFCWQLQNIILVQKNDISGINNFVVSKIKSNQQKWQENEAENMYLNLLEFYHQARTTNASLENKIENLILNLKNK